MAEAFEASGLSGCLTPPGGDQGPGRPTSGDRALEPFTGSSVLFVLTAASIKEIIEHWATKLKGLAKASLAYSHCKLAVLMLAS